MTLAELEARESELWADVKKAEAELAARHNAWYEVRKVVLEKREQAKHDALVAQIREELADTRVVG